MGNLLDISVEDSYQPSDGEINNIVYLCCKYTTGHMMRPVDLMTCQILAETHGKISGSAGISRLVNVACKYVWDHICGEPPNISPDDLFKHMAPILEEWYRISTPEDRAQTE